jgi:hypothetical protein
MMPVLLLYTNGTTARRQYFALAFKLRMAGLFHEDFNYPVTALRDFRSLPSLSSSPFFAVFCGGSFSTFD